MSNVNYLCKYGESIFDLAIKLYGSVDTAFKILEDNESVISNINTDLEGVTIVYDSDYKSTNIVPLIVIKPQVSNLSQTYKSTAFQTIFDVSLQVYGNLSRIVELVHSSTLNNINTNVKGTDMFNYTVTKSKVLDWIEKTGVIFQTKTPLEGNTGREHTSAFDSLNHT